mgnify:CR=1 FL=1
MSTSAGQRMNRVGTMSLGLFVVLALSLAACGGDAEDGGSGGGAATGGSAATGGNGGGSGLPHGIDCSTCSDAQVCWYTLDFDGSVSRVGCLELPAECETPADCECINAAQEKVCDQVNWVQNSNACSTHEAVPVVECISTLG